jgi:exportin-1
MEQILDFSQPVDVDAIEATVQALSSSDPHLVMEAQSVLTRFQEHGDAYTRVDALLERTTNPHTQFFALSVLEAAINSRWNVMPSEQQQGIRDFLVGFLMAQCQSLHAMRANRPVVMKLNTALVAVAKREWPGRWPTFVQEVVASAEHGPAYAENAAALLEMLVEEVFEFGAKSMTRRWIERKKKALADDFGLVWDYCGRFLVSDDTTLLCKVLHCVEKYVPYVTLELSLNVGFLQGITNFVDNAVTRDSALRVLTEVAQLTPPPAAGQVLEMLFMEVMSRAVAWLPQGQEPLSAKVVLMHATGGPSAEPFLDALCLFVTKFLPNHVAALQYNSRDALIATHDLIIGLLRIENRDIFKTCVDYCWWLGDFIKNPRHGLQGTAAQLSQLLTPQLSEMRLTLVQHMAKPEEVLIYTDEFGELKSEQLNDVEALTLYTTMRETLIFLTHIDHRDMINIIQRLMQKQVDGSEWGWEKLNVLCWSFGAISGALTVDLEKNTFVAFLRDLLHLCDHTRGRENRAVIASGIMYVVGQYPRFLNNHARFCRTVISKNCDFMKESFPGVKDMAVDTVLKVLRDCAGTLWQEAAGYFAREMISNTDFYLAELNHNQTFTFYEACGYLLARAPPGDSVQAVETLLSGPNASFNTIMQTAKDDGFAAITGTDDLKNLIHTLRCISHTAKTAGNAFIAEMQHIFWDLKASYAAFSETVSAVIAEKGERAAALQHVRMMRTVKKEILRIMENFIDNTTDFELVANELVPSFFQVSLQDYQSSVPAARDPQVLAVVTASIKSLKGHLAEGIPHILDAVFDSTAELIAANAEEYPEHRVNLFSLLQVIASYCFEPFLAYVKEKPAVMTGILWAARHIEMNTCRAALECLNTFMMRVVLNEEAATGFMTAFGPTIVNDTVIAMLDTMHRPVFKQQCMLLAKTFEVAASCHDPSLPYSQPNIQNQLYELLSQLPTLAPEQIQQFVSEIFEKLYGKHLEFKQLFSDLMVEVQVWGAEQENVEIREEERREREQATEGLARPTDASTLFGLQRALGEDLADD